MKTVIRQSVGIDISKDDFEARICGIDTDMEISFSGSMKFENNKKGFKQFVKWVISKTRSEIPLHFIMEATGIYYESLAYYLHGNSYDTHVLLPNMTKNFFKSRNVKSKTDKADAKNLAILGVERKFDNWSPPSPFLKKLRSLTRYHDQLKEEKTAFSNMLHSYDLSEDADRYVINDIRKMIAILEKKIAKSFERIQEHIKSEPDIEKKVSNVCTTPGLGLLTVAIVVAETFGFEQFRNQRQLTSYAGYDVVERQSGSSIKGKTRISKKGNKRIRKAMFFPTMSHIRCNEAAQTRYDRIVDKKDIKMIGQVAAQRRLLILIYTLWKNNETYDENKAAGIRLSSCEIPSVEYNSVS